MKMDEVKKVLLFVSPFPSHGIPLDLALGAVDKLHAMAKALSSEGVQVDVLSSAQAFSVMRDKRADVFANCSDLFAFSCSELNSVAEKYGISVKDLFNDVSDVEFDVGKILPIFYACGIKRDYDIVVSFFSETAFLKKVFKKSKVLFFETGLVCHLPFNQFHSFDSEGTIRNSSYIGSQGSRYLAENKNFLETYRPVLDVIRRGFLEFSAKYFSEIPDLHGLRAKWKKVYLVAGQPMDELGCVCSFSCTFEFLEYVLQAVPADSAVLVTEHPSFPEITARQHQYLRERYPNYIYSAALQALYSPSAVCLPLADAVVGISSTVILHAHALGKRAYSVGFGSFSRLNGNLDFSAFVNSVETNFAADDEMDLYVLDIIAKYSVPMALYSTPWLKRYFDRILNSSTGLPVVAAPNELIKYYEPKAFPVSLVKPHNYYSSSWSSAPISLVDPWLFSKEEEPCSSVNKKRVVATILDHYAIGGTQNVIRRLVDLMPDVHWVIFVERRSKEEYEVADNCELIEIGSIGEMEASPERKLARAVYEFNSKTRIDVFLNPMHWRPATLKALPLIKKIAKVPVIYWEHNSFFFPMYTGKPELHNLRQDVANEVDRVILLSEYDRWHFASHYPLSKSQVIHNPVPKVEKKQAPSLNKSKSVLIVGRFDPQKRMDRIPEIAEGFLSENPDWSFVVLGDGYLRPVIESEVSRTSVSDRVFFKGHVADPSQYYEQCSLFASLSDYEGDPLTFLEAKSNGLPIVAFELFQNTKVRDGVDGFYVNQDDSVAFIEKLSLLASDSSLRNKMATEGYRHFIGFDNAIIVDQWYELIESLIEGYEFQPKPVVAPSADSLHREAVHVALASQRVMQERLDQVRARLTHAKQSPVVVQSNAVPKVAAPVATDKSLNRSQILEEARLYCNNGQISKAIESYYQCIQKLPEDVNVRRLLAEALLIAGRRDDAIKQLKIARAIKPGNKRLRNRLLEVAFPSLFFWIKEGSFKG